jgi:hypothetical protein
MAKKKAANSRRGSVEGGDDEPAQFKPGRAKGRVFDPAVIAEEMKLWWVNSKGMNYVLGDEANGWAVWPEGKVIKEMRTLENHLVAIKTREDERISEVDRVLLHVMKQRRLEFMLGSLAGYQAGIHELRGHRILVKTAPQLVVPRAGNWPTIAKLIDGRLDLSAGGTRPGIDQTPWFHSWMKVSYESLMKGRPGAWRAGHAMILAGPVGCGKGRLQHQLITGLLGGRSADPSEYLFGRSEYNGEMFEAEHLLMEEVPVPSQQMKDRVYLAEQIKRIVANDTKRLRVMREDPTTVSPYWRLSISINNDPDKMRSLPLMTGDLRDKVLMFLVAKEEMPMPLRTIEEQHEFREAIAREMPAYADWLLNEWEVPAELMVYPEGHAMAGQDASRFGFREFQHPDLVEEQFDDTPAGELLALIDAAVFRVSEAGLENKLWDLAGEHNRAPESGLWHGSALTLSALLRGDAPGWQCSVQKEANKLLQHNNINRLLSRLAEDEASRGRRVAKERVVEGKVVRADTRDWKGWFIQRPVQV